MLQTAKEECGSAFFLSQWDGSICPTQGMGIGSERSGLELGKFSDSRHGATGFGVCLAEVFLLSSISLLCSDFYLLE